MPHLEIIKMEKNKKDLENEFGSYSECKCKGIHFDNGTSIQIVSVIPVTSAHIHSAGMLPGGRNETTLNEMKVPGIKMAYGIGEGVFIKVKNSKTSLIPTANFKIINLDASLI
jgi:hypothetical protein